MPNSTPTAFNDYGNVYSCCLYSSPSKELLDLQMTMRYAHVDRSTQVRAVKAMRSPLKKDPAS